VSGADGTPAPPADQGRPATIVVAPGSAVGRAVYQQIREWSAAGLVGSLLWVVAHDVHPGSPLSRLPANLVVRGAVKRSTVQELLSDGSHPFDRICLAALSEVSRGEPATDVVALSALRDVLSAPPTPSRVSALHCIAARHGQGGWDPADVWQGWQNLLISPEDAWAPDAVPDLLGAGTEQAHFVAHTASALAVLAGIWTGMPGPPLDAEPVPAGASVRLARSFVRRVDARDVSAALQSRLMDFSRGLPHPQRHGRAIEYVDQPVNAVRQMATTVITRHASLMVQEQEPVPPAEPATVTAAQALQLFPSFLGASLRNEPLGWLDTLRSGAPDSAAEQMQRDVYEQHQADFDVVVRGVGTRGVDARGVPVDLEQLSAAVLRLDAALSQGTPAPQEALPDTGELWKDVARGAMTLADAGSHGPGIQPLMGAEHPRIVRDPNIICPAATAPFEVPEDLVADIGTRRIDPHDIWGFKRAILRAQQLARPGTGAATSASRAREQMIAVADPLRESYAGNVGERIGSSVERTCKELAALLSQLSATTRLPDPPPELTAATQKLSRTLRMYTLLWASASVIIALLAWSDLVPLQIPVGMLLALLLCWVLASGNAFYRFTQAELARRMPRAPADEQLDVLRRNIVRATRAVHVSATLYREYLAWAPVLGSFVTAPFGTPGPAQLSAREVGRLPRSVGLAVAAPNPDDLHKVSDRLAGLMFPIGWMGAVWEDVVQDVPLHLLSERVRSAGIGNGAAGASWASLRARLDAETEQLVHGVLLSTVRVDVPGRQGSSATLPSEEFLKGLVVPAAAGRPSFRADVLTKDARLAGWGAVKSSVLIAQEHLVGMQDGAHGMLRLVEPDSDADTLDKVVVLLQMSGPLRPDQIALVAGGLPPKPPVAPEERQVRPDSDDGSGGLFQKLADRLRSEPENP